MLAQGIDYFPIDVDFFDDDKIVLVEDDCGPEGSYITLRLMCKIYREGFFSQWNEDVCRVFARRLACGINAKKVDEVVQSLVKRGFFDEEMYKKHEILTSHGIQLRYFEITKRRKDQNIKMEYILLDEQEKKSFGLIPKNPGKMSTLCQHDVNKTASEEEKMQHDVNIFGQSKVKESKVKESKEKESKGEGGEKKRESSTPVPTDSFPRFKDWISKNAPWCAGHLIMPTEQQLEYFKRTWRMEDVIKTILNLENNRTAREKYTNLATTIQNWLERDEKDKRITRLTPPAQQAPQSPPEPRLTPEEEEARSKAAFKARLQHDAANGNERAIALLWEMEREGKMFALM